MRRAFGALVLALWVVGCGDTEAPGAPGGGGNVTAGLPPTSAVWFGTAFDPTSLAITDKGNSFKAGTPIVAVGTLLATRTADQLTVKIENSGSVKATLPVAANSIDNTFAVDLTSANLGPGPYLVSFVDKDRKSLASASFNITP